MKELEQLTYSVGDLVLDPVSSTAGIILEVVDMAFTIEYRICWQKPEMNKWIKKYWDHYEIVKIPSHK